MPVHRQPARLRRRHGPRSAVGRSCRGDRRAGRGRRHEPARVRLAVPAIPSGRHRDTRPRSLPVRRAVRDDPRGAGPDHRHVPPPGRKGPPSLHDQPPTAWPSGMGSRAPGNPGKRRPRAPALCARARSEPRRTGRRPVRSWPTFSGRRCGPRSNSSPTFARNPTASSAPGCRGYTRNTTTRTGSRSRFRRSLRAAAIFVAAAAARTPIRDPSGSPPTAPSLRPFPREGRWPQRPSVSSGGTLAPASTVREAPPRTDTRTDPPADRPSAKRRPGWSFGEGLLPRAALRAVGGVHRTPIRALQTSFTAAIRSCIAFFASANSIIELGM